MAIVIRGSTRCLMCGQVIEEGQAVVAFPPFVANIHDPLWYFNDAAFHATCFAEHRLAQECLQRYTEVVGHAGPDHRVCVVCRQKITEPDDFFTLGQVAIDDSDPLYPYNYLTFHRTHLAEWEPLSYVYELLTQKQRTREWEGLALDCLLKIMAEELEK